MSGCCVQHFRHEAMTMLSVSNRYIRKDTFHTNIVSQFTRQRFEKRPSIFYLFIIKYQGTFSFKISIHL